MYALFASVPSDVDVVLEDVLSVRSDVPDVLLAVLPRRLPERLSVPPDVLVSS